MNTPLLLVTVPPFWIVSVPMPPLPTLRPEKLLEPVVQDEPMPVTVTVPLEPEREPMSTPPPLLTVPPFWIVSIPVPKSPTVRLFVVAPTTVAWGLTVSIVTLSVLVGTAAGDQLPAVNQSVEAAPVQVSSARAGVTNGVIVASASAKAEQAVGSRRNTNVPQDRRNLLAPPAILKNYSDRSIGNAKLRCNFP